jgi:outer membrane protein assembly factor BamB
MHLRCLLTLAVLAASLAVVRADDWPQFRGPNGSAVSNDKKLPTEWDAKTNIAWKKELAGYGWSSPIVWGDKVFVTSATSDKQRKPMGFGPGGGGGPGGGRPGGGGPGGGGFGPGGGRAPDAVYKWEVYCLSATDGKVLWHETAAEHKPKMGINPGNTYATETPVTDGERVYAYFGGTGVFCFDMSGKQLWKADLGAYKMAMGYGTGSSPALDGDRLFIQCDNDEKSFLVALDAKTGKELWKTARTEKSSWTTPFIWKNKERTEVVCMGLPKVRSYDPATGKQLWELGGLNGQVKASPAASAELLYLGTGGGFGGFGGPGGRPGGGGPGGGGMGNGARPLFAIKAGASGDLTLKSGDTSNDGVAWYQAKAGPTTASPLLYDGHLYILEERGGLLNCLDAKTGKEIYRERLTGARGFTSSPWAGDGKVYCLSEDGDTYVVQAGAEFKLLGKNKFDEMCYATPAVAGSALYLRTVDHLYCVKQK